MDSDSSRRFNTNVDSAQSLMRAQMQREFDLAHANYEKRIDLLRRALSGAATNGTACGRCQMANEIATEALARDDQLKT